MYVHFTTFTDWVIVRAQSLNISVLVIPDVNRCKCVYKPNMFNGKSTIRQYNYE